MAVILASIGMRNRMVSAYLSEHLTFNMALLIVVLLIYCYPTYHYYYYYYLTFRFYNNNNYYYYNYYLHTSTTIIKISATIIITTTIYRQWSIQSGHWSMAPEPDSVVDRPDLRGYCCVHDICTV